LMSQFQFGGSGNTQTMSDSSGLQFTGPTAGKSVIQSNGVKVTSDKDGYVVKIKGHTYRFKVSGI